MPNGANVLEEKVSFFFLHGKYHPRQRLAFWTGWEDHQVNGGNNQIPELVVFYRDEIPLFR